jgi:broad specificity phosphatase PhoE
MKPQLIYLIRHGESEGNIDDSIYKHIPDWKVNLTKTGKEQAVEAGKKLIKDFWVEMENPPFNGYLNPDIRRMIFYTSPYYRTRQTTAQINGFFAETVKEDPRLREQEWSMFADDLSKEKIERERVNFGKFFYRMPHGESGADVYDRITTFIDTLYRDFEKEDYPIASCLVSHGLAIKAFIMRFFHLSVEEFDSTETPENCEIFKMRLDEDKKHYNLITPLKRRINKNTTDIKI